MQNILASSFLLIFIAPIYVVLGLILVKIRSFRKCISFNMMREDLILGIVFVFLNFCLTLMFKKFSVDIFNVYFKCALVLTRNIGFVINRVETLAVIDEPDMLNSQNLSKSSSQWPARKNNMPRCHYARILVFYSLFKEFSTNIIAFWVKFPSFWLHCHVQHRVICIFE